MKPNDRLELHFLNVDHGDCTIVRHPGDEHRSKGRVSFLDINDWKDRQPVSDTESIAGLSNSLSKLRVNESKRSSVFANHQISDEEYAETYLDDPIEYFRSEVAEQSQDIWRFICTHPDMDHISGLDRLCSDESLSVFWDIDHRKDLSDADDWPSKYDKADWDQYAAIRNSDTDHQYIQPTRGSQKKYWEDDNMEILHPSPGFMSDLNKRNEDEERPEYNDGSYVIKLSTRAGSVLLSGDAEQDAWDEILDYWGAEKLADVRVLKAAHHGRDDGFHEEAVSAIDPEYVIASVGAKPTTDAYQDYYRACGEDTKIWSTRQYGTISFTFGKRGSMIAGRTEPNGIFDLPGR
jgi:beta-lactamase superfamily II metal-dependent hydrolase